MLCPCAACIQLLHPALTRDQDGLGPPLRTGTGGVFPFTLMVVNTKLLAMFSRMSSVSLQDNQLG